MNKLALWHNAKSEYSYAYDQNTLHILFRAAKNDIKSAQIIFGDPFKWDKNNEGSSAWGYETKEMEKRYQSIDFDYFFVEIKPLFHRTKYAFIIHDGNHSFLYGAQRMIELTHEIKHSDFNDLSAFYNFPYLNHEDLHQTPPWVKNTVWYQIFMDRFYSSTKNSSLEWGHLPVKNDELYGGDLKGVTQKLEYLADLGITGIYFTPIFKSPTAHKYDTEDYFMIDPQFGTNEDFGNMVKKAHALGIKVMLDGVFNHLGFNHPYFQDVVKFGEKSIYKDCFFIDRYPVVNFNLTKNGKPMYSKGLILNYKTFAFNPNMPKWNTSNPIVEKYLLDCVTFWIKNYDIDGWRIDVSNEISHDFLRLVKKVSRQVKKDTFILGENWDSSYPWLHGDQLDSVMNYSLSYPLWQYLEHKIDLITFKDMLVTYLATTPKNVMENMFNLIGSHDTERIRHRLHDDIRRVKLAFLMMFSSAGSPNIYYGDEIGLSGAHDPDNRRTMPWDEKNQDLELKKFVKFLIELRKSHPSLHDYDYHFVDSPICIFKKIKDEDEILVLINNGKKVLLQVPDSLKDRYKNLYTGEITELHDKIYVEEYQFMILQKESTL